MIKCNKCEQEKGQEEFYVREGGRVRLSCKPCLRKQKVMRVYNLTDDEYEGLYSDPRCHICGEQETQVVYGKVKELAVDHCHSEGFVRGLLCQSCNIGLGAFKDDADLLQSAIKYLKEGL
ncbi:putative endonuclease [Celeribacter phage P12053L]|uniref:Putative endonuclease n=1 Tax=Celeribacter phage P12053L TaxID=1197951 RepID=I6S6I7_9CAUD|nr:endonuclease VII [Celeribacter phage P12053L]AFM54640.1 putative endonuclease [Celeribacter phage P12053L]